MRLRNVLIEENEFENGLKQVEMRNLGQVVAFFGPNGAGKTRLLNSIQIYISQCNDALRTMKENSVERLKKQVLRAEYDILQLEKKLLGNKEIVNQRKNQIASRKRDRDNIQNNLNRRIKVEARLINSIEKIPENPLTVINLDFTKGSLIEVNSYRLKELDDSINKITKLKDMNEISSGLTPFLHNLVRAEFNSKNPQANLAELKPWLNLYREAKKIIEELMKMDFGYIQIGVDPVPSLDGRLIKGEELSKGQQVLLKYAAYLLSGLTKQFDVTKQETLEGTTVTIDEPEMHLHPAAVIELIDSLRKIVGDNGQIWLGTHAVSLLPHLSRNEIWTVFNGEVRAPGVGRTKEAVELLVGSEENVEKLRGFLEEPAKWEATKFAVECLYPPGRANFKEDDPQLFQISRILVEKLKRSEEILILDSGAGTGRLANMLNETFDDEEHQLIKYIPVEPKKACHEEIKQAAGNLMAEEQVYLSNGSIPGKYDGKFHVAVLCNVLHEIRPTRWLHELDTILMKLHNDGSIIICEDQKMALGELPNEIGYLVLGKDEIQCLFGLEKAPCESKHNDEKYKDRLLCVEIQKKDAQITRDNMKRAIDDLRRRLDGSIENMRKEAITLNQDIGKVYAFHSQMYVNCNFALKELN